jgi:hypothetical protein
LINLSHFFSILPHLQSTGLVDTSPVVMRRNGRIQKTTLHLVRNFKRCLASSPISRPSNTKPPWFVLGIGWGSSSVANVKLVEA